MKYWNILKSISGKVFYPIRCNATFFVFMYLLALLCRLLTLDEIVLGDFYIRLWLEFFLDTYVVCLILTLLPRKVRVWLRGIFYVTAYAVALVDVYCFAFYDSTLNPSMLMLVGETDSREAGEFITTLFSPSVVFSRIGWVLLLIIVNVVVALWPKIVKQFFMKRKKGNVDLRDRYSVFLRKIAPFAAIVTTVLLVMSVFMSVKNKKAVLDLMTLKTVGEVEHMLTREDCGQLITPLYRLAFSIYANNLASKQIDSLVSAADKAKIDSCSYTSPTIVLIIGESYGRHHDQQYGYFMETAPRQTKLEKRGNLIKFTDVVSCWNLTSYVFKNVLSMHVMGQKGEWCDYPLFPELFRKAGYHVTFLTNQFLPKAKDAIYDFSGGFFLNNPILSKAQFDSRNDRLYRLDEGLLGCFDEMKRKDEFSHPVEYSDSTGAHIVNPNLYIFHLLGQHVTYKTRYPREQTKFWASSYEDKRPDLSDRQRKILSQYDNACLYNDSIVSEVVRRFENEDAVVIYMPDHGEECYEGNRGFICRNHSSAIDYDLARYEFEVPFWIYCSPKYIRSHKVIYKQIKSAKDRRFMTDALPHLLVYLAGIHARDYHKEYNLLSPDYDEKRPRILKATTDYDKLRDEYFKLNKKSKQDK